MKSRWTFMLVALAALWIAAPAAGQGQGRGMGMGMGMMQGDDQHMADMQIIHYLLASGEKVTRTITERADGVETLTESDDPAVAVKIREHVAAMYRRVEGGKPIHQHDPLFREVFANADKIEMSATPTPKGIKVVETSKDPHVAELVKAHAKVVSQFIANGMSEAMKSHPVPDGR